MADYQDSKALVLRFYEELEAASADHVGSVLKKYTSPDYRFRGVHPFNQGADAEGGPDVGPVAAHGEEILQLIHAVSLILGSAATI